MRRGTERVVFGHMHEDPAVEQALAASAPLPEALVVASGGDIALTLIGAGMRVHAVDPNPAQLRLVELKMAAALRAGPERAVAWMTGPAEAAIEVLRDREAEWWRPRRKQLARGLCFCGTVDRRLRRLGPLLRWLHAWPSLSPGPLRRALSAMGTALLPLMAATLHGPAAAGRVDRNAVRLLVRRLHDSLKTANDNPLVQVLLGFGFGQHVPEVWSAAGMRRWAERSGHLTLSTASLAPALAARPRGSLGLVSVSNVPDLLDASHRSELLELATAALAPGGFLVVRSMLHERLDWHPPRVQELAPVADRSPLCPVIFLGRVNG